MKKKRTLPFGYTIRNGKIEIDQKEADVICEIFEDYIAGASMKELAKKMTRAKIPYTEKRVEWNKNVIDRILQNRKYTGEGEYAPIIDEFFFRQANSQKQERATKAPRTNNSFLSIVQPKIVCAECGEQMLRSSARKKGDPPRWKCVNPDCKKWASIPDSLLLKQIQDKLNLVIDNPDMLVNAEAYQDHEDYCTSAAIDGLEHLCSTGSYDDQYLIQIIIGNASDLYNHFSNSRLMDIVTVNTAFSSAVPTTDFNAELFLQTVRCVGLFQDGTLTITLKSEILI